MCTRFYADIDKELKPIAPDGEPEKVAETALTDLVTEKV